MTQFSPLHMLIGVLGNPLQLTILVVLVLMSLLSLSIAVERQVYLRRMRRATVAFMPPFREALMADDLGVAVDGAIERAELHRASHLARILVEGLREFRAKVRPQREARGVAACRRSLERAVEVTGADLREGLAALATVASSAPFVGLLGTVFGVINSFQGIGSNAGGGLPTVAGGIAEALFMTGVGLAVAIPAVWLYNYYTNRIERYEAEMRSSASELVELLLDRTDCDAEVLAAG